MQTSPFGGAPGVRYNDVPAQPADSIVFSGGQGNPNASGFIQGFMRPGGNVAETKPAGLLPSFLFNYTGGTQRLGDVSVVMSPAENQLVSKYPQFFSGLSRVFRDYGIVLVPVLFLGVVYLLKRVIK